LGAVLGPIIEGLKTIASRSTEIASYQETDKPIKQVDKPLLETYTKIMQNLTNEKDSNLESINSKTKKNRKQKICSQGKRKT
jgi:hypothetical protein